MRLCRPYYLLTLLPISIFDSCIMTLIEKYFPNLDDLQKQRFAQLQDLYTLWNSRINVISRKDIDELECHHVLHSLGITRMINFKPGTSILDFGTGGGFPGIPLAILFPGCRFTLVDSTGKKVKVAGEVASELGLTNVETIHARGEEIKSKYEFVVSRAVTNLPDLVKFVKHLIAKESKNALPNGLVCLKGGDVQAEIRTFRKSVIVEDLYPVFEEEFFKTKKVIYLPL